MKTEKRAAKVGEWVLVVTPWQMPGETYSKGDRFKVKEQFGMHGVYVDGMQPYDTNDDGYLSFTEYEVIVGEETEE